MEIIPITYKQASDFVNVHHRHHSASQGCKFCIGVQDKENLVGVAMCGRPVARKLDDGFTLEEKSIDLAGHARVIVNINDPKYNISGVYVVDPTWDNDLENDYYNHALMSFDKTCNEKRMSNLSFEDLIMNVKSMDEFNNKANKNSIIQFTLSYILFIF